MFVHLCFDSPENTFHNVSIEIKKKSVPSHDEDISKVFEMQVDH